MTANAEELALIIKQKHIGNNVVRYAEYKKNVGENIGDFPGELGWQWDEYVAVYALLCEESELSDNMAFFRAARKEMAELVGISPETFDNEARKWLAQNKPVAPQVVELSSTNPGQSNPPMSGATGAFLWATQSVPQPGSPIWSWTPVVLSSC